MFIFMKLNHLPFNLNGILRQKQTGCGPVWVFTIMGPEDLFLIKVYQSGT